MLGPFVDPKTVNVNSIPPRPWYCGNCGSPALVDSWREYGVCDPCAGRLRSSREWQARKSKAGDR